MTFIEREAHGKYLTSLDTDLRAHILVFNIITGRSMTYDILKS